jgi:1,4-alpha-glucan branching enzyme
MTAKKKRIEFGIIAPEAEQVLLAGSFNEWSEGADPMKKDQTGTWKKTKILPQGTYEYKFIVDGVWTLDPNCDKSVPNRHGTYNSVIDVHTN